ncbi:serine--tRNA ligase, mitochondrial-like [Liolophura sinensis]|uniref:serine--tRNA ligase, mitochondrial-like n=1 Tax=Liolophura sinensis TaxID=3198878 RepID=UPI003157F71A
MRDLSACPLNVNATTDANDNKQRREDFSEYFTPAIKCVVDFAKATRPTKVFERTTESRSAEWFGDFKLAEPDFDWSYLGDPSNADAIHKNIENRKAEGDIWNVIQLRQKFLAEKDETVKEKIRQKLLKAALEIPNSSHPNSPVGDETSARVLKTFGIKRNFSFPPKSALELGESFGLLRARNVVLTTGERTYYFIDDLALLEQALVKFTIHRLLKQGFKLISVPDLIHPGVIEGAGFPTTGERTQVYSLDPNLHSQACLSGTAEMPLAGFFAGETLKAEEGPQKLCAVSRCYRAETSNLSEERGIYRVHQFTKVEMFAVVCDTETTQSDAVLQEFVGIQHRLFSELGLHCRILEMPSEELGAPAYRKYDIEAWMPNKEMWGEISSASNCTDFQSRRLCMKFLSKTGGEKYVHTVNGTACAVPRLIIAVLENLQNEDGTVQLPESLWPYMNGVRKLRDKRTKLPHHTWQKKSLKR